MADSRTKKAGAIRREGVRPPHVPKETAALLGVIANIRKLPKHQILSEALTSFATTEEKQLSQSAG